MVEQMTKAAGMKGCAAAVPENALSVCRGWPAKKPSTSARRPHTSKSRAKAMNWLRIWSGRAPNVIRTAVSRRRCVSP